MSFILDALKKAQSQRKSDAASGTPAQLAPATPLEKKPSLWGKPLIWVALAALVVISSLLAWLRPWQTASPARVAANLPKPPQKPIALPKAATPASPQASVGATTPSTPTAARPAPPVKAAAPKIAEPIKPEEKKLPPPAAPFNKNRVVTLRELPEEIQKEIPTLAVGGYMYSDRHADRMLLVNKELYHEGNKVAPGLTLEKMTSDAAVFNYKGYHFRISY